MMKIIEFLYIGIVNRLLIILACFIMLLVGLWSAEKWLACIKSAGKIAELKGK